MSKAIVRIEKNADIFVRETSISNLFISEYLPLAPGDYVRVYLYGLMMAENGKTIDEEKLARILGITGKEVQDAWAYWARKGIIKVFHTDKEEETGIEYVNLIDRMYAKNAHRSDSSDVKEVHEPERKDFGSEYGEYGEPDESDEENKYADEGETKAQRIQKLIDESIREVYKEYEKYTGRLLSREETVKIADAIHVYNINPEVMSYAIKYCVDIGKYNASYIIKVALRWTSEGCRNIVDVKEYTDKYSKRNAEYAAIFKEIGFSRLPSPVEREMMSDWRDKMGFSLEEILEACRKSAGLREPSLKYVNKVLENTVLETGKINTDKRNRNNNNNRENNKSEQGNNASAKAKISKAVLDEYYEHLRNESERKQDAKIDALCSKHENIRELFEQENKLNNKIIQLSFKSDSRKERAELKERRQTLENSKREMLFEMGYPADYLDRKYLCRICKDTGMTNDGLLCACREVRAEEAYKWIKEKNKHQK